MRRGCARIQISAMEQVRCTNCGSTAIIPSDSDEFFKCEACGSTFSVARASAFSKVTLDHTQDIRAWREYLAKQLRLQQDSNKARDYGGVKLFAQKILSVLPDDFCAKYYLALAERFMGNDVAFVKFLSDEPFDGVTPDERKEVTASLISTVEPKYADAIKAFITRAYPQTHSSFDEMLDRNVKSYIQKLRYTKVTDRDVFICHRTAEPDQDIADAICTRLEERGLRCWIAPRNILAGSQNYERDILKGVENSRLFLLVSSFKSIYSEDCEMELKAAVLAGKALYSYRIDDTPYDGAFDRALSAVQWLDASDDPYAHLEQLVIDVKGILARDEREKAELEEKRLAAREKERVLAEERRTREQERLERLERIIGGGVAAVAPAAVSAYAAKLRRAEIEVQSQNYDRARDLLDEVLDMDPECAQAWWLMMLCEYRKPDDRALIASEIDFTAHRYYKNVVRFSDDEPTFAARLDRVTQAFQNFSVKAVSAALDDAQRMFDAENYDGMKAALARCAESFADENSIIFTRFPDIASRYFWLKLWSKYGQTHLVCVEDITREAEYKNAVKYASPAQASMYARARETVSDNAKYFLQERSKKRANDGKLVDYLVDNKGILPPETYNYYSSLLYFRKMLSTFNLSEAQLEYSTVDISTNEYFMLAQSLATEEQSAKYDAIVAKLDRNRAEKRERDDAEKTRRERELKRAETKEKAMKITSRVLISVCAVLSYVLAIVALTTLDDAYDGASYLLISLVTASAVFRLINDAFILTVKSRGIIVLTYINLVLSVLTVLAIGTPFVRGASYGILTLVIIVGIACITLESIKLSQYKKQYRK